MSYVVSFFIVCVTSAVYITVHTTRIRATKSSRYLVFGIYLIPKVLRYLIEEVVLSLSFIMPVIREVVLQPHQDYYTYE